MNFKHLLFLVLLFSSTFLLAQTYTLADWETEATSLEIGSFANGVADADYDHFVANPSMTGVNTSAKVLTWKKNQDAASWGGGFGFIDEPVVDFSGTSAIMTIKVYADHACNFLLKLEGGTVVNKVSLLGEYTTPNEWVTLTYDFSVADAAGNVGLGNKFTKIAFFPEYQVVPTAETQYWIDDLTLQETLEPKLLFDFETDDFTDFFTFGNGGNDPYGIVDNPNTSGINTSAKVRKFCKVTDAATYGGYGFSVDTLDFTGDKATVCFKVLSDKAQIIRMKLFESPTAGAEPRVEVAYTTPGEWQELCFNFASGLDAKTGEALDVLGHQFFKVAIYPDYPTVPTADECMYFDDFKSITNGFGAQLLIKDAISQNGDLSTFKGYVDAADLWNIVNQQGASVFAPTNAAFAALSAAELAEFDEAYGRANMIFHHVSFDSIPVSALTDGASFIMRNGQDATIAGTAINGANVSATEVAVNGFVHTVDAVFPKAGDPETYMLADYESADLSPSWKQFGTNANLPNLFVVDNPLAEGVNQSAKVLLYKKYPASEVWQGAFTEPERPLSFINEIKFVCADFYSDKPASNFRLKFEKNLTPTDPPAKDPRYEEQGVEGVWKTLCYDATQPSILDDNPVASPNIYQRLTIFLDYKNPDVPTDTVKYYIDNIRLSKNKIVSTDNISNLENFKMSPNPTSDYLNISTDTPIKSATIYDVTGRIMMSAQDPVNNDIDVRNLETGMYFVKFIGFNGQLQGSIRFVKQ